MKARLGDRWRSALDDLAAGGCWLAAADVWRTMVMTDNNFAHADTTYYTYVNNVLVSNKATKTPQRKQQ